MSRYYDKDKDMNKNEIPLGRARNLQGQKFGSLTPLYRVPNKGTYTMWHCLCDCGQEVDIAAHSLIQGYTKSCGCYRREKNCIDLTGKKIGRLLVVEKTNKRNNGQVVWKCLCDCGKIVEVCGNNLGRTTFSCGCLRSDISSQKTVDILGEKFGKLTVIEKTNKRAGRDVIWKCKCDCGGIAEVRGVYLRNGHTQSCGCIRSKGEEKISSILESNNIVFEREKTFDSCRFPDTNALVRFDFYISNKYIIEYDGRQHFIYGEGWNTKEHFTKTKEYDNYKDKWCKENNVPLIRIPYTRLKELKIEDLMIDASPFRVV